MAQLGVQILTMESVTSRIFRDATLTKMVSDTLASFLKELIDEQASNQLTSYSCQFLRYDLKYLAKPDVMAQIVSETSLVEDLLEAVSQFNFTDAQANSTQMSEFGDHTLQYLFIYCTIEMNMTSVIETKYLSYV